jgi:ABC-type sugar transport system ATPase subunit
MLFMVTITIRRATKRFAGGSPRIEQNLESVARATSSIFDDGRVKYAHQMKAVPEPPDRQNALDDLSLTVRESETLCILGPSGCGKTTLLKAIAGLIKLDQGAIYYDETLLEDISAKERGIGMVFQNYALYPHMDSRDNIGFFDIIRNQRQKITPRIENISQVMGVKIDHLLARRPPTLSGGERQRVALARCLARDPEVFLLDEPLANLDAKLRSDLRVQLKRMLNHYHITAVYVTHDQVEAIALADRIAVMRAGRIVQTGDFNTLYRTPVNSFVASFFGNPPMNLFTGMIDEEGTWHSRGFTLTDILPHLPRNEELVLGIRPEHIELMDEDGISAIVEHTDVLFSDQQQQLHLDIHGQRCMLTLPLGPRHPPDSRLYLHFPADERYFFDLDTGQRLG